MLVFGPDRCKTFSKGYFELATAQNPKTEDCRDRRHRRRILAQGVRRRARERQGGRDEDRLRPTYPPTTVDYTPIVRAVPGEQPEIVYVASYPSDTVGILHAGQRNRAEDQDARRRLCRAADGGDQDPARPADGNGIVNVELWEPVPTMEFPGIMDFLKKYQAKAPAEGRRPVRLFPAALRLCRIADPGRRGRGEQKSRRGQARPIHAQPHLPHDRRRHRLRAGRRVDRGAADLGAVPRHQRATTSSSSNSPRRSRSLRPPQYKTGEMIYPYTEARK